MRSACCIPSDQRVASRWTDHFIPGQTSSFSHGDSASQAFQDLGNPVTPQTACPTKGPQTKHRSSSQSTMVDVERLYVDLVYRASKKYANWDPEVTVEVGDYGRITAGHKSWLKFWRHEQGTFLKEGNIYTDGQAEKWKIPAPKEHGTESNEGQTWVTSKNARETDVDLAAGGYVKNSLEEFRLTYHPHQANPRAGAMQGQSLFQNHIRPRCDPGYG
jgi:hypothetical protein